VEWLKVKALSSSLSTEKTKKQTEAKLKDYSYKEFYIKFIESQN
jgi:hypothetical protein